MTRAAPLLSLIGRSTLRGEIAGAILSFAYTAVVIPLAGLSLVISSLPGGKVFDALLGAGTFAICAWPFALVLGIMPGIIIGAVEALIIGLVAAPFPSHLSREGATIIGLIVAALIVLGAHLVLGRGLIGSRRDGQAILVPYLFRLAGPSVLAVFGLTWVGWSALTARPERQADA